MVAFHGSLQAERVGRIDEYGDIDGILESGFEEDGTFLSYDGNILLLYPIGEVLPHHRVDNVVHLGGVVAVSEEELCDDWLVKFLSDVGVAANELAKLLPDDGAFLHETFCLIVA